MKLKMAKNSLFAILLRSPWWISVGIAAFIGLVAAASLRGDYALYGAFAGAPFLVVGAIAAWKQFRAPSASAVAGTIDTVSAMSWRDFSGAMEDAFRRDGFEVTRLPGADADFAIAKAGRTAVVSCRRWKAARNGIEPLRDLHAARKAREAHEGIFVTLGEITDNARRFAEENRIRVLRAADLAQLLRAMPASRRG